MKAILKYMCFMGGLLLCFLMSYNRVSAAVWQNGETMSVTDGVYTFHAHPSQDGKEAWIYSIEVAEAGTTQPLRIPEKVEQAVVTRLIADLESEEEFYQNLFGVWVEECHGADGSNVYINKIPEMTIPKSVTEIGRSAFSGMDSLKEVILPESLVTLGKSSFYSFDQLKKVILPGSFDGIIQDAFNACNEIESLTFGSKNEKYILKDDVMYSADGREVVWIAPAKKEVVISKSAKIIREKALMDLMAEKLTIPASVTLIDTSSVSCPFLKKIQVDGKNKVYACDGNTVYERKTGKLVIAVAVNGKAEISNQVKVITREAALVGNWKSIEGDIYVDVPSSVTKVGSYWFQFCDDGNYGHIFYFHSVKPPEGIDGADGHYVPDSQMYVPKQSTEDYKEWFASQEEYENIDFLLHHYLEGKEVKGKEYTYQEGSDQIAILKYTGKSTKVSVPSKINGKPVTEIGDYAFSKTKLKQIEIPATVTVLGEYVFSQCKQLNQVILHEGLKEIGKCCFYRCVSLKEVILPQTVEQINSGVFSGCAKLSEMIIPESVTKMGAVVFENCKGLRTVTLSSQIHSIEAGLFEKCTSLEQVNMASEVSHVESGAFNGCSNLVSIGDLSISEEVGMCAFQECSNLTSTITLEQDCFIVRERAFYNCSKLHLVVKMSGDMIDFSALQGCINVTKE